MRIGVPGCPTATARLLGVAVKTIAMPANSLSESPLLIVTPARLGYVERRYVSRLHLTVFICQAVSVTKGTALSTI
jgi:hypothetical protein